MNKRFLSIALSLSVALALSFFAFGATAYAAKVSEQAEFVEMTDEGFLETNVTADQLIELGEDYIQFYPKLSNPFITAEQKLIFAQVLQNLVIKQYGSMYTFDDFKFIFSEEREESGSIWINVDVIVLMTLTRHIADMPYVQGMKEEMSKVSNKNEVTEIKKGIDKFVEEREVYYGVADKTSFLYAIELFNAGDSKKSSKLCREDFNIYDRFDINQNYPIDEDWRVENPEDARESKEYGIKTAKELQANSKKSRTLIGNSPARAQFW